jgi:hypothetical protein
MTRLLRNAMGLVLALCAGSLVFDARCFAGSPLDDLLDRSGRQVEGFWQQVASFACTEVVTQEKVGRKSNVEYKKSATFDYLALVRAQEDAFAVEEVRLPKKQAPDKRGQPSLLATNGFPTLLLAFHPKNRAHYRYQLEPGPGGDGNSVRIRFEHIPGAPSTCALRLQDRIYPLELQGSAWIDPASGYIQKISAGLKSPLKDINIEALSIEVVYKSQAFPSDPDEKWLPSTAVISVRTALQHWRNTHQYSDYRRFTVESQESKLQKE